jgi:hypothetical protein
MINGTIGEIWVYFTNLRLVPRSRIVELHVHSPVRHRSMVL